MPPTSCTDLTQLGKRRDLTWEIWVIFPIKRTFFALEMVLLVFFRLSLSWETWPRAAYLYTKALECPKLPFLFFFFFSSELFLCRSYEEVNCTVSNKEEASQSLIKIINHQSHLLLPLATTELSQSLPTPSQPPAPWLFSKRLRTDFVQRRPAGARTNLCCLLSEAHAPLQRISPDHMFQRGNHFTFWILKTGDINEACPLWIFSFSFCLHLCILEL